MEEDELIEVSEILDLFNIDEINTLINDQINDDFNDSELIVDHLRPLYYRYRKLTSDETDPDKIEEANQKFLDVCRIFLDAIEKKFNASITDEWLTDNEKTIPYATLAMYSFFILDFTQNLIHVITTYINQNLKNLVKTFDDLRSKKDASTLSNKKTISPDYSLIVSNIYDISAWILEQLTAETFFDYLESSYAIAGFIRKLYDKGDLTGEFMERISSLYKNNITLKSKICFEVNYIIKSYDRKDDKNE
jgi:post-segregation antitoxin (ccd killing protein)